MKLSDNEAQAILDILNDHMRRCERQMHEAASAEHKSQLTREFADTHRLIKRFLESLKG